MNLPNKLTLSRIGILPFFVAVLYVHEFTSDPVMLAAGRWLALALFVAAALTDYYDGKIARRDNLVTNFGKLFDPLADKLLTMTAFVAFVELQMPPGRPILPAWAIILILAREFLVTGLRSLASAQGRVIAADRWGKQKTIWQLIGIIVILTVMSARETLRACGIDPAIVDSWLPWILVPVLFVIVSLTVFSGIVYLWKNWDMVTTNE